MDTKVNGLAETLKSLGIVSSASDAMNLAKNIVSTEEKLAKSYGRITPAQTKTKTYQEEIEELIRKTSPEYKNYHIPVKGYQRETRKSNDLASELVNNFSKQNETLKPSNNKITNIKQEKDVFYELEELTGINSEKESMTNMHLIDKEVYKEEVYTDIENSDKVLKELINQPLQENEETITTYPQTTEVLLNNQQEEKQDNDFIIEVKELEPEKPAFIIDKPEIKNETKEKPEQLFKEIKEDKSKPREIKNPIESIDLMNYFKSK
ncbi:MAG: hypothetical protein QXE31_06175 [Candidatus Woesearchaeota archaeon]